MKRPRFRRSDEEIVEPFLGLLFDDASRCDELVDASDSQFARRNYVRAAFAYFEGTIYWIKGQLYEITMLDYAKKGSVDITVLELLSDHTHRLTQDGKIKREQNKTSSITLLRFVFRVFAERYSIDLIPYFDGKGWACFQDAVRIRDRITHPKSLGDLEIKDDELILVGEGMNWFHSSMLSLLVDSGANPEPEK